jgi:hypothetical protein
MSTIIDKIPGAEAGPEGSKLPLFTPQFLNRLQSTSGLLVGVEEASRMINLLRNRKTESELKSGLEAIFKSISNPLYSKDWSKEIWTALHELLKYVALFDKDMNEKLNNIAKKYIEERQVAYLALLRGGSFSARCARLISLTDQEQIDMVLKDFCGFFGELKGSQARQLGCGPWSQIGVWGVEMCLSFFKVILAGQ